MVRAYDNRPGAFTPNDVNHRIDGTTLIDLGNGSITVIDTEDYQRVKGYRWHLSVASGDRYVCANSRGGRHTTIRLQRLILDAPADAVVDHISGDTLDNKKSNLRLCNRKENARNRAVPCTSTTGFKGVKKRSSGRYQASITIDGKRISLGHFDDPRDAAQAYNAAAVNHYGEFARINKQ